MPRKLDAPHPCHCSEFYTLKDGHREDTACSSDTRRTYAPGHDARLAGFLARMATYRETVYWDFNGVQHSNDALSVARAHLSDALAAKVLAAFDRKNTAEITKAEARKTKGQQRELDAARQAEYERELRRPTPQPPQTATIKVGRWAYEAEIDANGTATYHAKSGGIVAVAKGKYQIV